MIVIRDLQKLSLDKLQSEFCQTCKKQRRANGATKIVYDFALHLYAKEFERRADLIPTPVLLNLINSGLTFSFTQKFLK